MEFRDSVEGLDASALRGFFENWPNPPSEETFLRALRGSSHVVLAVDESSGAVVGFVNAVSDGVLAAYIPLLEVRPEFRGSGLGSALVERLLAKLDGIYMVDLCCEEDVVPFYDRLGFLRGTAMMRRNRGALGPAG